VLVLLVVLRRIETTAELLPLRLLMHVILVLRVRLNMRTYLRPLIYGCSFLMRGNLLLLLRCSALSSGCSSARFGGVDGGICVVVHVRDVVAADDGGIGAAAIVGAGDGGIVYVGADVVVADVDGCIVNVVGAAAAAAAFVVAGVVNATCGVF
jgi:hypothetical protein